LESLNGLWQARAATVNPSPPVAVSNPGATGKAAAKAAPAPVEQPEVKVPSAAMEALKAAAKEIEAYLQKSGRSLEFRVDDASGRTVVSVRNPQTGELIRQIPNEEVLRIASALNIRNAALVDIAV
jgi:flagellar protein FlaG